MRALVQWVGCPNPPEQGLLRILRLDWFHLSWLLYLIFWVIEPLAVPSTHSWIYLVLALSCFLPLYVLAHGLYTLRTRRWAGAGMVLLALVYVPVNTSSFGIYIFIAATIPELVETARATYRFVAAECMLILIQAMFFHLHSWEWAIAIGISMLTAVNIQHFKTQRVADARLRMAHDEIERLAKTAERERIARDLHDVLGHTLSLISIKSELAARLLPTDPERTAQELAEIQTTARRALAEVRQTVSGYRAQGLTAEIAQAVAALAASGVTLTSSPVNMPRLPAQHEASLALILREAVTNIVRHAGARSCAISITADEHVTMLEVCDDSRGMHSSEGNGLRGMRERVRELGGELQLGSEDGVVLRVTLPRSQPEAQSTHPMAQAMLRPAAP